MLSNRYIHATATCDAFRIQSYNYNDDTGNIVYIRENEVTDTESNLFPYVGTNYISSVEIENDFASPITNCGPRCGNLVVTQISDMSDLSNAWLYFCESTVHPVVIEDQVGNTEDPEIVGDQVALYAATSLSASRFYSGRFYGYYPEG